MASKTLFVLAIVLSLAATSQACGGALKLNNACTLGTSYYNNYLCLSTSACNALAAFGSASGTCPIGKYWCFAAQTIYSIFCSQTATGRRRDTEEEEDSGIKEGQLSEVIVTRTFKNGDIHTESIGVEARDMAKFEDLRYFVKGSYLKILASMEKEQLSDLENVEFKLDYKDFGHFAQHTGSIQFSDLLNELKIAQEPEPGMYHWKNGCQRGIVNVFVSTFTDKENRPLSFLGTEGFVDHTKKFNQELANAYFETTGAFHLKWDWRGKRDVMNSTIVI